MESFSLVVEEIYEAVAVALCRSGRGSDITQLLNCIRSSGILEPTVVCDSVLMACISSASSQTNVNGLDLLAHHISNQALKVFLMWYLYDRQIFAISLRGCRVSLPSLFCSRSERTSFVVN